MLLPFTERDDNSGSNGLSTTSTTDGAAASMSLLLTVSFPFVTTVDPPMLVTTYVTGRSDSSTLTGVTDHDYFDKILTKIHQNVLVLDTPFLLIIVLLIIIIVVAVLIVTIIKLAVGAVSVINCTIKIQFAQYLLVLRNTIVP